MTPIVVTLIPSMRVSRHGWDRGGVLMGDQRGAVEGGDDGLRDDHGGGFAGHRGGGEVGARSASTPATGTSIARSSPIRIEMDYPISANHQITITSLLRAISRYSVSCGARNGA